MLMDLCETIVKDLYGDMAAKVIHILTRMGRLTAADVSRRLKVHVSAVLRTLVSLVQMQLVLFWHDEKTGKTFYSANPHKIYSCVRAGWILSTQQQAFGSVVPDHAHKILSNLLVCGNLKAKDLAQLSECSQDDVAALARANLLLEMRPCDFWPTVDLTTHLRRQCYNKLISDAAGLSLSDAQKKVQVQAALDLELNTITKRNRDLDPLPSDTLLVLNEERYLAVGRRNALVEFAALRVGSVTAKVYEQVLIASEANLRSLKQKRVPCPETNVTTHTLVKLVGNIDLASAFITPVKSEEDNQDQENKRQKLSNGKNSVYTLSPSELLNRHLQLLEESPVRFLRRAGDRGGGEWFVPFDQVVEDLKRMTFDTIVKDKFGRICARLLRVVREQVKVDEKYLGQVALVQQRDIRREMTKLQLFGFADIQEVPRGNDRAPGRNFYFWYHRPEKAYARVVEELYGSMCHVYGQLDELRTQHTTLLTKMNRQDVQTDPEKYLTQFEKGELHKYHEREQELVSQIMSIDTQVRVFKDY